MPVRAPSLFMAWNIASMGRTLPGLQYSTSRTSSIGISRVGMCWDGWTLLAWQTPNVFHVAESCKLYRLIALPRHSLSYSSWRRHQSPVSLRPLGARSSHWYMPQRPSTPRSYAEYVWYTTPSSSTNALIPGPSCRYVGQSVPTLDVSWVMKGSLSPDTGSRKCIERKLYSTAPAAHSSLVCVTWKS